MPRIPARVTLAPLVLASCLLSSSCCGLYELWGCGPQQPLVPISFDSPRQALDSFRAAIRYQDSNVLYRCMSEEFKEEQGFDALSFAIFWDKLIEREPAIPALGDARIVATRWLSAREKLFTLETYGQKVRVSFSSTPSYEYGELRNEPPSWPPEAEAQSGSDAEKPAASAPEAPPSEPDDELQLSSAYLQSWADVHRELNGESGRIQVSYSSEDLIGLDARAFAFFRIGRTWKLRRLELLQPED